MAQKKLTIGLTIGDINGIGPEIMIKALRASGLAEKHMCILYGSSDVIVHYDKLMNDKPLKFFKTNYPDNAKPKILNIINVVDEKIDLQTGKADQQAGEIALKSLEAATQDAIEGKLDILITAPLNKSLIKTGEDKFTGQTEYLQKKCEVEDSLMLMCTPDVRVALVTNHLPFREVAEKITTERILAKIKLMDHTLQRDFLIDKPRIAVLGLNPHAGDYGLLGSEENEIISPAINKARDAGILAIGPYSADGLFGSGAFTKFDGILAMYHDQGLVPFKAITFDSGVNFTAGLPIIRTSPDHGTAYEIAGKNEASFQSFLHAIYTAIDVHQNRQTYDKMTANPVKQQKYATEK